jgi:hypothetical protein
VIYNEGDSEPTGIFPILISKMINKCCGNCSKGHGVSHIKYDTPKDSLMDVKNTISSRAVVHLSFPIPGKEIDEEYKVG